MRTIPCATAEELLNHLMPHHGYDLWNRGDQDWIFRGQAEAIWDLVPRAHRLPLGGEFRPFIPGQLEMYSVTHAELRELELFMAMKFASTATERGWEIPHDMADLRDADAVDPDMHSPIHFPRSRYRGAVTFAQHYRVPTRLLDWSTNPLMAAYFAGRDAVVRHEKTCGADSDHQLAIWAMSRTFLNTVMRRWNPGAVIVTAPTTSNPNLRAQRGLFTLVRFTQLAAGDDPLPPTINALFSDEKNWTDPETHPPIPVLYKFTLPHAQARRLLYFVHLHGIDASAVYPGPHSIVEAMQEADLRSVTRPLGPGEVD